MKKITIGVAMTIKICKISYKNSSSVSNFNGLSNSTDEPLGPCAETVGAYRKVIRTRALVKEEDNNQYQVVLDNAVSGGSGIFGTD